MTGSSYYVSKIKLPEHFVVFSFPNKNITPYVNRKTIVLINITNKTSKGILTMVRCMRGTGRYNSNSDKLYLNKVITSIQKPVTIGVQLPVKTCKLKSFI